MYIKCIDWTQSLAYVWTGSAQGFFKSMDYIQYRTVEIYGQIMKAASQPTVFIYYTNLQSLDFSSEKS
jgi:hypothetical protein